MRNVKLRAFKITNSDINNSNSDFGHIFTEKLVSTNMVEKRRMRLSLEDPKNEEDLISNYQQATDSIFCTMLRIELSNNVQHIASDLFKKNFFSIDELNQSAVDGEAIFKSSYYFLISKNFLITNLAGNITIKRLETYLNWFLGKFYQITPLIDDEKKLLLSEIKSITIGDNQTKDKNHITNKSQNSTSIFEFGASIIPMLKKMFNDTKSITDVELEQIISVKMLIQFRKPKKNDDEELLKAYGALLKPVSDLEDYTFHCRNGKKIKNGQNLLLTKDVKIETTDSGFLDENQLMQAMVLFIRELRNES